MLYTILGANKYFDDLTDSIILDKADEAIIDTLSATANPFQRSDTPTGNDSSYDPSEFNSENFCMTSTPIKYLQNY